MNGAVYSLADALGASPAPGNLAAEIAKFPGLDVEFYQPEGEDRQTPHERDELYVIARGSGMFELAGERRAVSTGDVIYVAAHAVHRFVEFSGDFAAWVVFWP
jgi:quercetin dioxygenase-like cupin family protein